MTAETKRSEVGSNLAKRLHPSAEVLESNGRGLIRIGGPAPCRIELAPVQPRLHGRPGRYGLRTDPPDLPLADLPFFEPLSGAPFRGLLSASCLPQAVQRTCRLLQDARPARDPAAAPSPPECLPRPLPDFCTALYRAEHRDSPLWPESRETIVETVVDVIHRRKEFSDPLPLLVGRPGVGKRHIAVEAAHVAGIENVFEVDGRVAYSAEMLKTHSEKLTAILIGLRDVLQNHACLVVLSACEYACSSTGKPLFEALLETLGRLTAADAESKVILTANQPLPRVNPPLMRLAVAPWNHDAGRDYVMERTATQCEWHEGALHLLLQAATATDDDDDDYILPGTLEFLMDYVLDAIPERAQDAPRGVFPDDVATALAMGGYLRGGGI